MPRCVGIVRSYLFIYCSCFQEIQIIFNILPRPQNRISATRFSLLSNPMRFCFCEGYLCLWTLFLRVLEYASIFKAPLKERQKVKCLLFISKRKTNKKCLKSSWTSYKPYLLYTTRSNNDNGIDPAVHIQYTSGSPLFKYELFMNFWLRFFDTRRETILKSLS